MKKQTIKAALNCANIRTALPTKGVRVYTRLELIAASCVVDHGDRYRVI